MKRKYVLSSTSSCFFVSSGNATQVPLCCLTSVPAGVAGSEDSALLDEEGTEFGVAEKLVREGVVVGDLLSSWGANGDLISAK